MKKKKKTALAYCIEIGEHHVCLGRGSYHFWGIQCKFENSSPMNGDYDRNRLRLHMFNNSVFGENSMKMAGTTSPQQSKFTVNAM